MHFKKVSSIKPYIHCSQPYLSNSAVKFSFLFKMVEKSFQYPVDYIESLSLFFDIKISTQDILIKLLLLFLYKCKSFIVTRKQF